MALKYDFFEVNELNRTQGKYRARAVSRGRIDTKRLVKWISQVSGLNAAETKGFIEILTDSVLDFIVEGYEVEVGKLGYFSASVTSRLVDSPTEIRAESVRFNRLNLRANVEVKRRIIEAGVEKARHPRYKNKVKRFTREERAKRLKKFLTDNTIATRSDYSRITGVHRGATAVEDLNVFIQEGWLERHGAGRTVVYMLKKVD